MSAERFSLRAAYLYLVCLITLVISLYSAAAMVRGVVEIAYPDPYVTSPVCVDTSPDADKRSCVSSEQAALDQRRAEQASRRWAVLSLVGSTVTFGVAAPVYLYHWRRVQRDRAEQRSE
jgi:hypothetical protein